jgi:tetratricopeptide (TPR) repeat protein
VTSYSRQDVLRILQISSRQLFGWERAGLIPPQQAYTFQDLGQLRTLRVLREEDVPAASIRDSIVAMRAVAGMSNPLLEASLVRTGTRLGIPLQRRHGRSDSSPIAFRLRAAGTIPQLKPGHPAFARARATGGRREQYRASSWPPCKPRKSGDKNRAIALYEQILERDPGYAAAYINLGTIYFHLRRYGRAEELYRRATETDPGVRARLL